MKENEEDYKEFLAPQDSFRFFIRKHKGLPEISNEDIDDLGVDFAKYLSTLGLNEKQKSNTIPKSAIDIIMNIDHPMRTFGFPLVFAAHFYEFIEIEKKKWEEGK